MTYPNCWSTSTMIDISDYSLFLRETVSSKKEDKETSLQAHPINDAKRTLIRIADWYDETLSVEQTSYMLNVTTSRSRSIVCTITAIG